MLSLSWSPYINSPSNQFAYSHLSLSLSLSPQAHINNSEAKPEPKIQSETLLSSNDAR
jgi:hypothetical protein